MINLSVVLVSVLLSGPDAVFAAGVPVKTAPFQTIVTPPTSKTPTVNSRIEFELQERQTIIDEVTCGFYSQDPSQARTAGPGFDCRVDVANSLWGFCPTTVVKASDCGLAGACIDSYSCVLGCGNTGSGITTFFCTESDAPFCSTVLSDAGVDQTYSYIACGPVAVTQTLFAAAPVTTAKASTSATSTSSTSSSYPSFSLNSASLPSPSATQVTSSEGISDFQPKPNHIRAIVVGAVGGVIIICTTAIGFCVRRHRRAQKSSPREPSPKVREAPAMQVGGIHEADGGPVRQIHETDGIPRRKPLLESSELQELPG